MSSFACEIRTKVHIFRYSVQIRATIGEFPARFVAAFALNFKLDRKNVKDFVVLKIVNITLYDSITDNTMNIGPYN